MQQKTGRTWNNGTFSAGSSQMWVVDKKQKIYFAEA